MAGPIGTTAVYVGTLVPFMAAAVQMVCGVITYYNDKWCYWDEWCMNGYCVIYDYC